MFIGHYAVGFAAKKWAPKTSLGTLFAAAIFLDLVWPLFVLLGWEKFNISPGITRMSPFDFTDYPLSHSLVMALAWGALFGLVYLALERNEKASLVLGGLVVSHWFLDLLVHRPDLPLLPAENPLYPTQPHKWGLGLWNHPWVEMPLEILLLAGGFWLYWTSTRTKDRVGFLGLLAFLLVLLVLFVYTQTAPPPTNSNMVAYMAQFQVVLVAWAVWVDEHRKKA